MQLADFDFDLPSELIAQYPAASREASRLMVLERAARSVRCGSFPQICDHLRPGDLLVLNDARVIPARLLGHKASGGKVELVLLERLDGAEERWACLSKTSKPLRPGTELVFAERLRAVVEEGGESPRRHVRFHCGEDFAALLEEVGQLPLPPYIRREVEALDKERYQTVFARRPGAVAAPTAGLHFTPEILAQLQDQGVEICSVTLDVGLGTFWPVRSDDVRKHRMHGERYHVPLETASAVNRARAEGRRVVALGTTSARTLESAVDADGRLQAGTALSELFIFPGFRFRLVDGLITNFHLPRSTLLMLVAAFAGQDFILQAYRQAVSERFRFFSYGDCMLIL